MTRVEISLTFSLRNTCDIPSRSNSKRNKQYRLTVNWHASIYFPMPHQSGAPFASVRSFPKEQWYRAGVVFSSPPPPPFPSFALTPNVRVQGGKRSAQASAHPLSQAHGGLFCVLPCRLCLFVKCTRCERLLLVEVCKAFLFVFCCCSCWFFVNWKLLWIQNNQC